MSCKYILNVCFSFLFFCVSAYCVQLGNCLNVCVEQELAVCVNPSCKCVLGSFNSERNFLSLIHVREVLFRPLGSYVPGDSLHNINTYRMMYMEMLEREPPFSPRVRLNIPQHMIDPIDNVSAYEDNIYQVRPNGEGTSSRPFAERDVMKASVRVRDLGSYKLFGKNQNFLGRMVIVKKEACKPRMPAFENIVQQANRTLGSGVHAFVEENNAVPSTGIFMNTRPLSDL